MKWLKALLAFIWKIYFLIIVFLVIVILYPIQFILLRNEQLFHKGFRLIRTQARLILFFVGVRKEVVGSFPTDNDTTYIICPNHSSYLDILLLYSILPDYFIFLGKKELGDIPIFNIYFKKMNILIDRTNPKAAHEALMKAIERLEKGTNLVIFPEGTIPTTVPKMKPFKNGAFKVSTEMSIPIIPISFKDNYRLLEDNWRFGAKGSPGRSRIFIHPTIFPEGENMNLLTLRENVKQIINSKLD